MNARAVQCGGIVQSLGQTSSKLRLSPGQAGQATLASRPVARRGVEQHLLQAVAFQLGRDVGRRVIIGKQVLHRPKAIPRRSGKTRHEGQLLVQEGQVGGKIWHGLILPAQLDEWSER